MVVSLFFIDCRLFVLASFDRLWSTLTSKFCHPVKLGACSVGRDTHSLDLVSFLARWTASKSL